MLEKILQASAGTGKTYQIVKLGLEPAGGGRNFSCLRRTVFLSFSNAAAEEIKSHLYEEIAPKSAGTFAEAVGTSEARVYTVHSFCFELVRIFRYELGLPADAQFPADENSSVWGDCAEGFFRSHWDFGSLRAQLDFKEGAPGYDLLKALHLLGDRRALKDFITDHGQKIFFLGEVLGIGMTLPDEALKEDIETLAKELTLARLLDKDTKNQKLAETMEKVIPLLNQTRPVLEKIITYIGRHIYLPHMYARGVFDFDSLVFLVVKILKDMKSEGNGMSDFLKRLNDEGFGFDRLFIDEAQDCDILMNNLIGYFLGDNCPVKTVLVGDAKQSIYRWRNAYPEEFLKMCREAAPLKKRESLLDSYRIKNQNTLDFINALVEKVSKDYGGTLISAGGKSEVSFFDYHPDSDRLARPRDTAQKKWMQSDSELKVGYAIINDKLTVSKEYVNDFIDNTPGRTGVIFRSRGHFWKSRLALMLGDKLQYRLAEPFEEEKKHGDTQDAFTEEEILDIVPDYYLLKTLAWLFTSADRDKAAAALLLTRKGLELAARIWPEHINDTAVSTTAGFVKAVAAVYGEIQAMYYGGPETSVAEKLCLLMDKRNLWPVFFRPQCLMPPERAARALNHALAGLYLYETRGAHADGGKGLLSSLGSAKIPFESCFSYDVDQDKLSFAEAVTIHSSKGLTYDKVIFILESNKLLKAEMDGGEGKDEFAHLFHADFGKVAGPNQAITINYFPYLGALTAKHLRESGARYPVVDKLYNETFKRVKAEKADLFYVAVTRTREHLMFLDIGTPPGARTTGGKESTAKPPMLEGLIDAVCVPGKISKAVVPAGKYGTATKPIRSFAERVLLELSGAFRLVGVRADIKDKVEIHVAPRISSGAAKLIAGESLNTYIGVRVHQLVAELMRKTPGPAYYEGVIKASPVASLDEPGRLAAKILLSPENKILLQSLFKSGVENLPELRVWGLSEDGGYLLNGIIDGVIVGTEKVEVLEYKTVFGDSAGQEELGKKQVGRYLNLLMRLKGSRGISGKVISVKASL